MMTKLRGGRRHVVTLTAALGCVALAGCGGSPPTPVGVPGVAAAPFLEAPPPKAHQHTSSSSALAAAKLGPPIDVKAVAAATGFDKPDVDGAVVKVSLPRGEPAVNVDGWKVPPFMGLTSWVAFGPGREGVAETMIMGDLVLFEDEVSAVMSVLLEGGAQVTALHNHFFFDQPHIYFMHVGGEGTVKDLGNTVKLAFDKVAEVRKKAPRPSATFGVAAQLPAKSSLDGAKLEAALDGRKGTAKDGMWKLVVGRDVTSSCGCAAGKSMGVTTWAGFAGADDNAVVDGDFAVLESELQPVLKELRSGGVHVVAIHHHMSGESPRMLFLHFWGRGKALDLAAVVKRALAKTAVASAPSST